MSGSRRAEGEVKVKVKAKVNVNVNVCGCGCLCDVRRRAVHPTKPAVQLNMGNTMHPRRRRESATPPDTGLRSCVPAVWFWRWR